MPPIAHDTAEAIDRSTRRQNLAAARKALNDEQMELIREVGHLQLRIAKLQEAIKTCDREIERLPKG